MEKDRENRRKLCEIYGIKIEDDNDVLGDVSEPLQVNQLTINPMDKDGDFEIEMWDEYTYLSNEEAKSIIEYLTKNINAR